MANNVHYVSAERERLNLIIRSSVAQAFSRFAETRQTLMSQVPVQVENL